VSTAGRSVLFVDDDTPLLRGLVGLFERKGWSARGTGDPWAAIDLYDRERPEVVFLDLDLPHLSGLRVLELLRERDPDVVVVMLTGHAEVSAAVEAMRLGAENFITKPADAVHLEAVALRASEKAMLRRHTRMLHASTVSAPASLGESALMRRLTQQIATLAGDTSPVLITGETGTGKSWAAQELHRRSPRAAGPFIEVNAAGLSATFLDSELFGHERGAFTDAKSQKLGLFELADGGTLFLDEIGDLAPDLQPKLLRVLESQRFRRLGGTREIQVDVRLVAATHRDLADAVASGTFRSDLFYRIAVFPVHLPPLREREPSDITALAVRALADTRRRLGRGPTQFTAQALDAIVRHRWPGNIRELRNVIERLVLVAGSADEIRIDHLPSELRDSRWDRPEAELAEGEWTLAAAERRHIERVLAHFGNHRTKAARALGISRATLYNKLFGMGGATRTGLEPGKDDQDRPESGR
jgi:DNA-binding NtrC family response regulator